MKVWHRLTSRFEAIKSDESLITITPSFASAIMDLYTNSNSKVRLTGTRMKMLQLTLPFVLRDLLKPEADKVNKAIRTAKRGELLYNKPQFNDPSTEIIELLIKAVQWNIKSRQKEIPVDKLSEIDALGVELLETCKTILPDRTGTTDRDGEPMGWVLKRHMQYFI